MRIELKDRTAETVITYLCVGSNLCPEIRKYLPQKAAAETEALRIFLKLQKDSA